MNISTKQLKTLNFNYGDGSECVRRFAVFKDGVRIGTVYHVSCDNGVEWFDPLDYSRGKGYRGDGKEICVNYTIQRKKSMTDAIETIVNNSR